MATTSTTSSSVVMMVVMIMVMMPVLVMSYETVVSPVIPREGEPFLMECEGKGEGEMAYFVLHQKGKLLPVGSYEELNIEVFQNATVYFKSVSLTHEGTHLCLRNTDTGEIHSFPSSLRVRPPPPSDLWGEVYQTKFVTGFLAALVVAAMFTLGCLVYHNRWQPRKQQDGLPILATNAGYDNPVMTRGEDVDGEDYNTKM